MTAPSRNPGYRASDGGNGPSDDGGCKLIPFPQVRRGRFVMRHAARLAGFSHKTAEKLLAYTLQQQAATMARRGIAAEVIERESRSLERAIRAELWWQILLRPGDGVA